MSYSPGISQRAIRVIEPSRPVATILYAVLAVLGIAVLGVGLQHPGNAWPPDQPTLPFPVSGGVILAVAALTFLCLTAAVVNGRRWLTARAVVRISKDPALAGALPPLEEIPLGPFVRPSPPLQVQEVRLPWWPRRPRPLSRVTRTHNVLGGPPLNIVYLRVFENEPRARTFVRGAWREFGYVYLLRSAASVSPRQFKDAKRADALESLFVKSLPELDETLTKAPTEPDPPGWRLQDTIAGSTVPVFDRYGAYPTRSLVCHADFWQTALDELLRRADLVVLDLSGYLRKHRGTQYELQQLVDTFPISRVILLADPWSNVKFLEHEVHEAWTHMAVGSPNALAGPQSVLLARTDYYVQYQTQYSRSSAPVTTRTELRASRAQTRWLLAHVDWSRQEEPRSHPRPRLGEHHSSRPSEKWPEPSRPTAPTTHYPHGRVKLLAIAAGAIATVSVVIWAVLSGTIGSSGIAASAVADYYIRSGPSTDSPTTGVVRQGQEVRVDCLSGGWARLDDPSPGGYVYGEGLAFEKTPPPC